jgi:hypothetical protein
MEDFRTLTEVRPGIRYPDPRAPFSNISHPRINNIRYPPEHEATNFLTPLIPNNPETICYIQI